MPTNSSRYLRIIAGLYFRRDASLTTNGSPIKPLTVCHIQTPSQGMLGRLCDRKPIDCSAQPFIEAGAGF